MAMSGSVTGNNNVVGVDDFDLGPIDINDIGLSDDDHSFLDDEEIAVDYPASNGAVMQNFVRDSFFGTSGMYDDGNGHELDRNHGFYSNNNGGTPHGTTTFGNETAHCANLLSPFAGCFGSRKEREQFMKSYQDINLTDHDFYELLNRGLDRLTDSQRQAIFKDAKGIGNAVKETEDLTSESLEEMEYELMQLSRNTAYEQALQDNPNYVKDPKLRLAFLRADLFDSRKAAHRMIRFMEEKLSLFGPNCLTRNIMLDDLTEDDHVVLNSGVFQASPGVDRFGRHVWFTSPALRPECTTESMMKVVFYQMQQLFLQHDENHVQTRGLISILYVVDKRASEIWGTREQRQEAFLISRVMKAVPVRSCHTHTCYNDPTARVLLGCVLPLHDAWSRLTMNLHFGTHIEVIYDLMKNYGIPASSLPVTPSGEMNLELYKYWVPRQREKERLEILRRQRLSDKSDSILSGSLASTQASSSSSPTPMDMITSVGMTPTMEPGTPPVSSPGNSQQLPYTNQRRMGRLSDYGMAIEIPEKPGTTCSHATVHSLPENQQDAMRHHHSTSVVNRETDLANSNGIPIRFNEEEKVEIILEPGRHDVVFGKGYKNQKRPGNVRFRLLIDMHISEYEEAKGRAAKTEVFEKIIRIIHQSNGKFLKEDLSSKNKAGWEEVVDLSTVRNKVSHAFRIRSKNQVGK